MIGSYLEKYFDILIMKSLKPITHSCWFIGSCTKGEKCKFSHNLDIERKAEKRSLYVDMRAEEEGTSEDWDEEKLMSVIAKKHAEADKKVTTTIVKPEITDGNCW